MGASSVTGKGVGAAGNQRGPANGRDYFVAKVSPHVVKAGTVTLDGSGDATVTFSAPLANAAAKYVVIATNINSSATAVSVVSQNDVSSQFANFVLKGTASKVVNYIVVSVGSEA